MIILVVIVVGVVILVVLFRAKKRKQQLEITKLHSVTIETEDILKQEETSKKAASPSAGQQQYVVSNLLYQSIEQHCDAPNTSNVPKETDIYMEPDITSSLTVEAESANYETVYSEPIQPSLFTDAVGSLSDCEDLHPYAPIYTIPINLPKSEVLSKISGSNIREIRELGMGQFGKVILAETVGLSAKDLKLSESDDDKSKSTLVAVKKLKSGAPNATKDAFEKEVNFMSRLTDRNVIRILGVCYEDTPFIMMEYMERGDLNQYLKKFKTLSTTDSEPHGQITTSTLVHIATQIASAMKYLNTRSASSAQLVRPFCRTESYKQSFFPDTIYHWNHLLPSPIKSASSMLLQISLETISVLTVLLYRFLSLL